MDDFDDYNEDLNPDYIDHGTICLKSQNIFGNDEIEIFNLLSEICESQTFDNEEAKFITIEYSAEAFDITHQYPVKILWRIDVLKSDEEFSMDNIDWNNYDNIYQIDEIDLTSYEDEINELNKEYERDIWKSCKHLL